MKGLIKFVKSGLGQSFTVSTLIFIVVLVYIYKNRSKVLGGVNKTIDFAANTSKGAVGLLIDPKTGKTYNPENA